MVNRRPRGLEQFMLFNMLGRGRGSGSRRSVTSMQDADMMARNERIRSGKGVTGISDSGSSAGSVGGRGNFGRAVEFGRSVAGLGGSGIGGDAIANSGILDRLAQEGIYRDDSGTWQIRGMERGPGLEKTIRDAAIKAMDPSGKWSGLVASTENLGLATPMAQPRQRGTSSANPPYIPQGQTPAVPQSPTSGTTRPGQAVPAGPAQQIAGIGGTQAPQSQVNVPAPSPDTRDFIPIAGQPRPNNAGPGTGGQPSGTGYDQSKSVWIPPQGQGVSRGHTPTGSEVNPSAYPETNGAMGYMSPQALAGIQSRGPGPGTGGMPGRQMPQPGNFGTPGPTAVPQNQAQGLSGLGQRIASSVQSRLGMTVPVSRPGQAVQPGGVNLGDLGNTIRNRVASQLGRVPQNPVPGAVPTAPSVPGTQPTGQPPQMPTAPGPGTGGIPSTPAPTPAGGGSFSTAVGAIIQQETGGGGWAPNNTNCTIRPESGCLDLNTGIFQETATSRGVDWNRLMSDPSYAPEAVGIVLNGIANDDVGGMTVWEWGEQNLPGGGWEAVARVYFGGHTTGLQGTFIDELGRSSAQYGQEFIAKLQAAGIPTGPGSQPPPGSSQAGPGPGGQPIPGTTQAGPGAGGQPIPGTTQAGPGTGGQPIPPVTTQAGPGTGGQPGSYPVPGGPGTGGQSGTYPGTTPSTTAGPGTGGTPSDAASAPLPPTQPVPPKTTGVYTPQTTPFNVPTDGGYLRGDGEGIWAGDDGDESWMETMQPGATSNGFKQNVCSYNSACCQADGVSSNPNAPACNGPSDQCCWYTSNDIPQVSGAANNVHPGYDVVMPNQTPFYAPISGKVIGTSHTPDAPGCVSQAGTNECTWAGDHGVVMDGGLDSQGNQIYVNYDHANPGSSDQLVGQYINEGDQLGVVGWESHIHVEAHGYCPETGTVVILDPTLVFNGYYQQQGASVCDGVI